MAELPLLLFPSPALAERTKRKGYSGKMHMPSFTRQGERLSPLFKNLQTSFNDRNVELQQSPAGITPEQVLVIETIGNIENFVNAVKKISGLEWMGEIEIDQIAPDEDFYYEDKLEKELSGRLYLVMSNQTALTEMLSLWKQYQKNPQMKFERGLTKFRDVYNHLKSIRLWGVADRLAERQVFDDWKEDLQDDGQRPVKFEAEIWYKNEGIQKVGDFLNSNSNVGGVF